MSAPRAVLHIGTMKTGTSTLQAALGGNHDFLVRHNFRYLGWPMRTSERIGLLVDKVRPDRNIVISDEGLWHFCGTARSDTPAIAGRLARYRVTIIVYFRRPDEYVESWFSQGLKNGLGSTNLVEFLSSGFVNSAAYRSTDGPINFDSAEFRASIDLSVLQKLQYFRDQFPDAEFVVRPFERGQLVGDDIVVDFLATLGPDVARSARDLVRGDDENVSPNADTTLLANLLRRGYDVPEDVVQLFLMTHSPPLTRANQRTRILRFEEARAINEAMRPIFREVQATYGGGESEEFFRNWDIDPETFVTSPVRDLYDRILALTNGIEAP